MIKKKFQLKKKKERKKMSLMGHTGPILTKQTELAKYTEQDQSGPKSKKARFQNKLLN